MISAFAHFFRAPLTSAFSALSVLSNNLADTEIPEENQILIQSTSQSCYKMLRLPPTSQTISAISMGR